MVNEPKRLASLRTTSMPEFFLRFTLHDSHLLLLTIDPMGRLLLEIDFDRHWNPAVPEGYDRLVIQFDRLYRLQWTSGAWVQSTVDAAESAAVDPTERVALLDDKSFDLRAYQEGRGADEIPHPSNDETLTRTKLTFVNWSVVDILHSAPVRCAVTNPNGDVIELSAHT